MGSTDMKEDLREKPGPKRDITEDVTPLKMRSKLILVIALAIGLIPLGFFTNSNVQASAEIPTFALEGDIVSITIRLDGTVDGDIELEEYEFHYIMNPDIAPEQDTWPHEKQMKYMQEVLNGKADPYAPSLEDENIKKILEISPKRTYKIRRSNDGSYAMNWQASHGKIFFRVRTGGRYIGGLYTIRVHCRHIDMRSFENLKDALRTISMPIMHRTSKWLRWCLTGHSRTAS